MTHTEIFTLILAGILAAAITVMVVAAMHYGRPEARKARVRATNEAYRQDLPPVEPGPAPGARAQEPQEPRVVPLAVDPENMPTWKTYTRASGRPGVSCHCHPDRVLESGQRVLWWPAPDGSGGVRIFCEDGVEVQGQ